MLARRSSSPEPIQSFSQQSPMTDVMSDLTDHESAILDMLWNGHVYFIQRRYSYCQALIGWAIRESGNTLNGKQQCSQIQIFK